jgi:hypothetical protein
MAAFNKFQPFVEDLAHGVHDLGSDVLQLALTNAANAPVNTYGQLSQLTQISYANLSSLVLTVSSSAQTGGTYKLVINDLQISATGTAAAFQYVVIFNQTAAADELIGWYNYGSEVTLNNGDTFTVDFDGTNGVLTLA